jgi:hypothetical protein
MKLKSQRIVSWFLLFLALGFSAVVRYRLLSFPLDRDEGEYAYAGQLLLSGVPPYKFAYNMKLPGTYLAFAGLMAVFGQTTEGVHFGLLAVNLAAIVLLFVLTRQLFDDITAGAAVVNYSILSISVSMFGMNAHATHFVSFYGLAGTIVLWRYTRFRDWRLAVSSGLLLGLAFLMKQQGLFLIVFGEICLLVRIIFDRESRWFGSLRELAAYNVGATLPYLLTCLWLWYAGVWDSFKFWTIDYAAHYVQYITWREGFDRGLKGTYWVIGNNYPLWLLAALGLIAVSAKILMRLISAVRDRMTDQTPLAAWSMNIEACWFVCGYLVFSAMCVLPSFIFRQHYFVVIQPALAILAGIGCRLFGGQFDKASMKDSRHSNGTTGEKQEPSYLPSVDPVAAAEPSIDHWYRSVIVLTLAVIPTVLLQAGFFFLTDPMRLCRQLYGANPFPECQTIANYVREHTQTTDTIAVLGSEPQLYFLSQRRSATGFIYTYPMMEPQPFAHRMHEQMIAEIERAVPAYIVDVQVIYSWMEQNNGEKLLFEWKQSYLERYYKRVGVVCIIGGRSTVYHWDREAESFIPKADGYVVVYQRTS